MRYELMNKDNSVATLEVSKDFIGIVEIHSMLPGYLGDISDWVQFRTSPMGRQNIATLLKLADIQNKEEYLKVTYGISLTDTFWVRQINDDMTWARISPYRNRFSKLVSEVALNCNYIGGNIKSPSPDYTVDGSADKCWVRENGKIYLFKTCGEKYSGITGNRPYCEYYASQLGSLIVLDRTHIIPYSLRISKTRQGYTKAYSYCPIFTSEEQGFLPYQNSKFRGVSLIQLHDTLPASMVRDKQIIREMLLIDSIVLNFDRHQGNYGFLFNNNNYRIMGMAPIFDLDCSFGFDVSLQNSESIEDAYQKALYKQPRTETGTYIQQAKWALTNELRTKLSLIYPFKFKRIPQKSRDLEDERIQFMEYIVNRQIQQILGR